MPRSHDKGVPEIGTRTQVSRVSFSALVIGLEVSNTWSVCLQFLLPVPRADRVQESWSSFLLSLISASGLFAGGHNCLIKGGLPHEVHLLSWHPMVLLSPQGSHGISQSAPPQSGPLVVCVSDLFPREPYT